MSNNNNNIPIGPISYINGHVPSRSRTYRTTNNMDDSTDTEGESSYHGWSDVGWGSSATATRQSTSSDELPRPILPPPTTDITPITTTSHHQPNGRTVSFSSGSIPHRRGTATSHNHRPSLHTAGSQISLDTLSPSVNNPYTSTGTAILNIGESSASPSSISVPNFGTYANPPAYSEPLSIGSYAYPRSRRKSTSHHPAPLSLEDETSEEDPYVVSVSALSNGGGGSSSAGGLPHKSSGKRRHTRGNSFSYLPFHRRRRASSAIWPRWLLSQRRPSAPSGWKIVGLFLLLLTTLIYGVKFFMNYYELHLELEFYPTKWVSSNFDDIQPLRGCFSPHQMSPEYNQTRQRPQHQLLAPGMSMRRGMQCYDFSSTIQSLPGSELRQTTYHTYWRSDLIAFGERQSATLTAFLATQPLTHSRLILWTNGADFVKSNEHIRPFLEKWGNYIEVRQVDMTILTKGTEIEGLLSNDGGGLFDERAWVDGDAVRLLVLWHFGGIWMDMDQILTRDLHPLTEAEFVTKWDCSDKPHFVLNGALMHFHRHSPYLCEAFHIMASSPLPKPNTFTWGSHLYSKLHRRLVAAHIRPFTVLPWCFTDPRNCRKDNSFPDPFRKDPEYWSGRRWDGRGEVGRSGRELLEEKVGHVWTVHLHNQWTKNFPVGGWVSRLLDGYKRQLAVIEDYARTSGDTIGQKISVRKVLPTPSSTELMSGLYGTAAEETFNKKDNSNGNKAVAGVTGKKAIIPATLSPAEKIVEYYTGREIGTINTDEEVQKLVQEMLEEDYQDEAELELEIQEKQQKQAQQVSQKQQQQQQQKQHELRDSIPKGKEEIEEEEDIEEDD